MTPSGFRFTNPPEYGSRAVFYTRVARAAHRAEILRVQNEVGLEVLDVRTNSHWSSRVVFLMCVFLTEKPGGKVLAAVSGKSCLRQPVVRPTVSRPVRPDRPSVQTIGGQTAEAAGHRNERRRRPQPNALARRLRSRRAFCSGGRLRTSPVNCEQST